MNTLFPDRGKPSVAARKKTSAPKKQTQAGSLQAQLREAEALTQAKLGYLKEDTILIDAVDVLKLYIENIKTEGVVAIDTETTGLDPVMDQVVGVCLYTPGQLPAYIPVRHESLITGNLMKGNIDVEEMACALQAIADHPDIRVIMQNAKFDYKFIKEDFGVEMPIWWDTMVASKMIDENRYSHSLKNLYADLVEPSYQATSFETLFKKLKFSYLSPATATLYAAHDAYMTYKVWEWQHNYIKKNNLHNTNWYNLLTEIEIPLTVVVGEMELNGFGFDLERAAELNEKYTARLENITERFEKEIARYAGKLDEYKKMNPKHGLSDPILITSPKQLATLLYDVLGYKNAAGTRSTDEKALRSIDSDLTDVILEYRECSKLLSTYIVALPKLVHPDGRLRGSFNQYGAATGRFSSSEPNFQNIPSHNKEIRPMFKAKDGHVLIGGDFSKQELLICAHLADDKKMIEACEAGQDLYSVIASLAYNKPYEQCIDSYGDEGKNRRGAAKAITLGVMYGKGIAAIGKDLGITYDKAQEIYKKIMKAFPGLKQFMDDSQEMARTLGYVDTVWGRRRHLPNMMLPKYEFEYSSAMPKDFDPLFFDEEVGLSTSVPARVVRKWTKRLNATKTREGRQAVIDSADKNGIKVKDNGGYIAEATRQAVNSRVQGSAADMMKRALLLVHNDPYLKKVGAKIIATIHDEMIIEVKEEFAEEAAVALSACMVESGDVLKVPVSVDWVVSHRWYGDELKSGTYA